MIGNMGDFEKKLVPRSKSSTRMVNIEVQFAWSITVEIIEKISKLENKSFIFHFDSAFFLLFIQFSELQRFFLVLLKDIERLWWVCVSYSGFVSPTGKSPFLKLMLPRVSSIPLKFVFDLTCSKRSSVGHLCHPKNPVDHGLMLHYLG